MTDPKPLSDEELDYFRSIVPKCSPGSVVPVLIATIDAGRQKIAEQDEVILRLIERLQETSND